MAATVTVNKFGRVASLATPAVVSINVDANSLSYATSLGGLALDIYAALATAGPYGSPPNGNDVVGVLPLGVTAPGKFLPTALTLGTVTSTAIPVTLRFYGTGTAASAGLAEIADGACTQTVTLLVLLARGGTN